MPALHIAGGQPSRCVDRLDRRPVAIKNADGQRSRCTVDVQSAEIVVSLRLGDG